MDKIYTTSEVRYLMDKVYIDGKIEVIEYFLEFVETDLNEMAKWSKDLSDTEFMSENWFECNGSIGTLTKMKKELQAILKLLNEKK